MAYVKNNWKDHIEDESGQIVQEGTPLSATNLNNIETGIAENAAQLSHMVQENINKDTAIASAMQNNIRGIFSKYLLRSDAQVITTSNTTVSIPDNKIAYFISAYKHRQTNLTLIFTDDTTYNIFGGNNNGAYYGLKIKNILFDLLETSSTYITADLIDCDAVCPKELKSIRITSSPSYTSTAYLLLDRDKGGIDFSDFN